MLNAAGVPIETPGHIVEIIAKHPLAGSLPDQNGFPMPAAVKNSWRRLRRPRRLCALPAGAEDLKPICSDRPGRGTGACTVEDGHAQSNWACSTKASSAAPASPPMSPALPVRLAKYGVSDSVDVEAGMALYQSERVHDATGTQTASGIGDLFLHAKYNPNGAR